MFALQANNIMYIIIIKLFALLLHNALACENYGKIILLTQNFNVDACTRPRAAFALLLLLRTHASCNLVLLLFRVVVLFVIIIIIIIVIRRFYVHKVKSFS